MSVSKRGDVYHYEFEISKRRFRGSTHCTTEREALAEEKRQRELAKQSLALERVDPANSSVSEVFERYWKTAGHKLGWATAVKDHMIELEKSFDPATLFRDVGSAELAKALEDFAANTTYNLRGGKTREGAPVSDSTVNRRLAVFRQIYYKARDEWELPVKNIVFKKHTRSEPDGRVRHIALEQCRILISRLAEHDHIMLMVAWSFATGCRLDETETLPWARVNLETLQAEVLTKGRDKNKTRFIDLSADGLNVLAQCDRGRALVFDSTNRRRIWEAAVDAAGLDDFTWHDMRHTFANIFGNEVGDLAVLQKALGHAKIETTMRYRRVLRSDVKRGMDRMPALLTGPVVALKTAEGGE